MKRTPDLRLVTLGLLAVVVMGGVGSCAAESSGEDPARWVAQVTDAHRVADEAIAAGEGEAARAALLGAAEASAPAGVAAEDARVARQDAYFRLAQIALGDDDAEGAERYAGAGLGLGVEPDVFTANLYIARGRAREALGRELEAATDYHEALKINDALLARLLGTEREAGER